MKCEVTLPGIVEFDASCNPGSPTISDTYRESLSQLVLFQRDNVTHFYGSPLDLDEDSAVWMSPVEVDDGDRYSYFQILYVNTTPEEAYSNQDLPVSILKVDEVGHKLAAEDHTDYKQIMHQFDGRRKHVLIRQCDSGMAYYPRSVIPLQDESQLADHLELVIAATGLREPEAIISPRQISGENIQHIGTNMLHTVHARKYPFAGGEAHAYGIVLDDDPWKYYEVITPRPIEEISTKDLLVRVDSGCDIGQIYDDKGCDCREQLHTALTDIQETGNGAVIHIPSQDGRGFGSVTKMETEGIKRGIRVATNRHDLRPVDTITAAQLVLGAMFDIRTYEGAGKILTALGIASIILQTDNRKKAEGLTAGGLTVVRRPTYTTGSRGALHHVEAKHRHGDIYYGTDED